MCKLSGVYRLRKTKKNRLIAKANFRDLMEYQSMGNEDSTGIGWIDADSRYGVIKDQGDAIKFFKNEENLKVFTDITPRAIIGHCRYQTQGEKTDNKNNHPLFTKTGIMAIHNGVISNDKALFDEYKIARDAEVDSEIIPKLVEHFRHEGANTVEAIQEASKKIRGSMAFSLLLSSEPDNLYLVRRENQLYTALDIVNRLIYFATDEGILKEILKPTRALLGFWEVKSNNGILIQEIELGRGLKITPKGVEGFDVENPPYLNYTSGGGDTSSFGIYCQEHKCWYGNFKCTHKDRGSVAIANINYDKKKEREEDSVRDGFSEKTVIKKPSEYSNAELQARLDYLEDKEFEKPLLPPLDQEARRIDDTLQSRRAKQLKLSPPDPENHSYTNLEGWEGRYS